LPADGNATQASFGGIVGEADPAVIEEAGERIDPLEHVVHGLGDVVVTGEPGALRGYPVD
jgi:hypothetical protein